jgi:transposase
MGRSRGGLATKIHALTDARGLPLELVLTPGQAGGCAVATQLLGHLRQNTILLADKAYDADWLRRQIVAVGAVPNIPPMAHRRWKPCFSPALYCGRNRIERFFNRIKSLRPACHALRKARRKLPCHVQAGSGPTLAAP